MEEKKLTIHYQLTKDATAFDTERQELIRQTIAFADHAYAPYSGFHVSAGLLLENGTILRGTNVENASYPVGICAERTLISHAVSNYPNDRIRTIAVFVDRELQQPVPPCGLCRQTLVEVESRQEKPIELLLIAKNGPIIRLKSCIDLLPLAFDNSFL